MPIYSHTSTINKIELRRAQTRSMEFSENIALSIQMTQPSAKEGRVLQIHLLREEYVFLEIHLSCWFGSQRNN